MDEARQWPAPVGSEDNEALLPGATIQLLATADATSIQGRWGLAAEEGTPVLARCPGPPTLFVGCYSNSFGTAELYYGWNINPTALQIWNSRVNKTLL